MLAVVGVSAGTVDLLAYRTLVALHVAAGLKHHFVDRDGLLLRMLPARRT